MRIKKISDDVDYIRLQLNKTFKLRDDYADTLFDKSSQSTRNERKFGKRLDNFHEKKR